MNTQAMRYHHWVEWSEEDSCFIGYCPDLADGGMCHGDDPKEVYSELLDLMEWNVELALEKGQKLPEPRHRPGHLVPA